MKAKLKIIILAVLFVCIAFTSKSVNAANLGTNELLKFKDYTITKSTTISQINANFGQPKITGESAFGGSIYSWYDDDYSWFLCVETNAKGEIKGYGCLYGDFVSNNYTYGGKYNSGSVLLGGTVACDRYDYTTIYGVYEYNCTTSEVTTYLNNYINDSKYLYDLQAPSFIVSKVVTLKSGKNFEHEVVSDEIFYMNENLKANGTNLRLYAQDNGKSGYIESVKYGNDRVYSDLPNPVKLGKECQYLEYASNYKYMLYGMQISEANISSNTTMYALAVDPDIILEKDSVDLTAKELNLLEAVKEQYALYNDHGQAHVDNDTSDYEVTPVYKELPLVAGKFADNVLAMATDYINIARAGLGENLLTLDSTIADEAQHKAVLVYYMNNVDKSLGKVDHSFSKIDSIDQEFYDIAMKDMNENLYAGGIMGSIPNALNDAYGDAIECGHRYNLLNPAWTKWGIGAAGTQGCHKFSGNASHSNELVAWPSNGIFPMDLGSAIGNWTARFYKNYSVTSDTEVTIKCLNSGKVYEITNENKSESGKVLKILGSAQVTFRDDSIVYEDGDVFEITLSNVKNSSGELSDYTYRSVFKSLSNLTTERKADAVEAQDITIDTSDTLTMLTGDTDKINAIVAPSDATNKLVKFTSSNENVVSVRQDGTLYANKAGKATITIKSYSSSGIEKQVEVTVKNNAGDSDYLIGDLDRNGVVNANDAAVALDLYKYENATDEDILIGDIDENGVINANDAALILDIYKYGN